LSATGLICTHIIRAKERELPEFEKGNREEVEKKNKVKKKTKDLLRDTLRQASFLIWKKIN